MTQAYQRINYCATGLDFNGQKWEVIKFKYDKYWPGDYPPAHPVYVLARNDKGFFLVATVDDAYILGVFEAKIFDSATYAFEYYKQAWGGEVRSLVKSYPSWTKDY